MSSVSRPLQQGHITMVMRKRSCEPRAPPPTPEQTTLIFQPPTLPKLQKLHELLPWQVERCVSQRSSD